MEIFKSSKKELILTLSTRKEGNMRLARNRLKFIESLGFNCLKMNNQVHREEITRVDIESKKRDGDGLISRDKRICLGIIVADCLPVFLYNDHEFGLIHCGWRGLSLSILEKAVNQMDRKNLKGLIGPGILKCHFKVKQDLLSLFPEYIFEENYIDLQKVAQDQAPFAKTVSECTFCLKEKYFSFRRGDKEAMMAVIGYNFML